MNEIYLGLREQVFAAVVDIPVREDNLIDQLC